MSKTALARSARHPHLRPPVTCFLPNCAMVVEPACPVCGCKQEVTVKVSGSDNIQSANVALEPSGEITRIMTTAAVRAKGPAKEVQQSVIEDNEGILIRGLGPVPSYFSSDVGAALVKCDNADCDTVYQVSANLTLSAVAFPPGPDPVNSPSGQSGRQ